MSEGNLRKIKLVTHKISFLMAHQHILPDLKELVAEIYPTSKQPDYIDRETSEYLLGAYDALIHLLNALEEKGNNQ